MAASSTAALLPADQLQLVIAETLSPRADIRQAAEERLQRSLSCPGQLLELLKIVAQASTSSSASAGAATDAAIRQAAAVNFKNAVKKGWSPSHDEDDPSRAPLLVIAAEERQMIKSHLVQLMCTVPTKNIQAQLSEAISLIAQQDYPDQWPNLLTELVQQFSSPDTTVLMGVLQTAHAIAKRFRYQAKSDDLYRVILYTLEGLQGPLLTLCMQLSAAVEALANEPAQIVPRLEALRLACRLIYSLNFHDLPEFFEDHMPDWTQFYAKFLQYQHPQLEDPDEEDQPSPVVELQGAILEIIWLYADKDEECFLEYLPQFTTLVWNLLMGLTTLPKHDALATISIKFLSSLVQKQMHKNLFQGPGTLRQIVLQIVLPNLTFRECDQVRFEDDPMEYLLTEVEGSDSESRRRCSQDLLRAMGRQFETETTALATEQIKLLLATYYQQQGTAHDPPGAAKDAAINLMMAVAIRRESSRGVSEVNPGVQLMEFFTQHILPELQDTQHQNRPVVKAAALKFVTTFRLQFAKEHLVQLLPGLINHLSSPLVVVHTFAALAIERILFIKEDGTHQRKITGQDLQPYLNQLFVGLFAIVDNVRWNENEYVMKCVMRSLSTAGEDIIPVTETVITRLTAALGRAATNPRNPQYNHYLFESIACLVRSVGSRNANQTMAFEPLLFEPFNIVLQMDVAEFTPYVFQILAQLLEYRPAEAGMGPGFANLFQPLLTPLLWEKRGNVPALARLLQAYLRKSAAELTPKIDAILGIFQKLLASKATEEASFHILESATVHFPQEAMEPKINTIFQLLLTRLQSGKTPRFGKLITNYMALFAGKYGSHVFLDRMNALQNGLALMFLFQVWLPRLKEIVPVQMVEAKTQVVGLTRLLCDSPALWSDGSTPEVWSSTLSCVMTLLTSPTFRGGAAGLDLVGDDEVEIGYDAQFSRLQFAVRAAEDPFADVTDPVALFVQSLQRLSSSHPGRLPPLIQQGLGGDAKLAAGLEDMLTRAGVKLN